MVDESTGEAVVDFLRSAGHDVLAVGESMPQARDSDILAAAQSQARILITNDKDFGEMIYRSGQRFHGVLLLRLRNQSSKNRVRVVRSVLTHYAERLAGHFVVAGEHSIRIRSPRSH